MGRFAVPAAYELTPLAEHIEVRVHGRLDEPEAQELLDDLRARLDAMADKPHVLIDLDELTESTILARAKLIELQTCLGLLAARTVWLCDRPRYRGLALMVCHAARDPNAKVVANREQAVEWMGSSFDRINDIAAVVEQRIAAIKARRKAGKKEGS